MIRSWAQLKLGWGGLLLGSLFLVPSNSADAGAVIFNTGSSATATIALGINPEGHLNTTDDTGATGVANSSVVGLAFYFTGDSAFYDATSPGCYCEGWGVSATYTGDASAHSGYANVSTDGGPNNLTLDSFVTDAAAGTGSFATSSTHVTSLPGLKVTQSYAVATNTSDLFKNTVTITNDTEATLDDVRYVRVMDWDVPHTEFDEYVTINGTTTTTLLERSHNNGFNTADPLGGDSSYDAVTEDADFFDYFSAFGDGDHGAYFRFNFGTLLAGESYTFDIFYGAAEDEIAANAAIVAESIELYSLGQSDLDGSDNGTGGGAANFAPTFIFGFKGVGGIIIDPPPPPPEVPEPSTMALALLGLGGLGVVARRRRNRN